MKKALVILLCGLLILGGCSKPKEGTKTKVAEETAEGTKTEEKKADNNKKTEEKTDRKGTLSVRKNRKRYLLSER